MNLNDRIHAFSQLGDKISGLSDTEKEELNMGAARENSWFTPESVQLSLSGIGLFLKKENLNKWVSAYAIDTKSSKRVGVAMAGNIPLVGFHDLLSVLLAGHQALVKLSSQDSFLIKKLTEWLVEINPSFKEKIQFVDLLKKTDAIIATGSDNTARYFEYYFRNIPHIIRKNRSSCAVIMGEENPAELRELGKDVFSYFGLGCRNVSKVFVPEEFQITRLFDSWNNFKEIINHHRYANNYDYQKSIMLVNNVPFLDSGFLLITQSQNLVSPISVLYYETYHNQKDLRTMVEGQKDKLQCIVSANGWYAGSVPFGKAQMPELWDYADGIDTMKFLTAL